MKTWLIAALVAGLSATFVPFEAEAKRLGGGKSSGLQREMPARTAPDAPAPRPANPAQATPTSPTAPVAGTAAASSRPAWLAPVAGLAAGLGLAALASYMGFGEELASMLMLVLLAVVAIFVVRWLMRSFGGRAPQPAAAGAAAGGSTTARSWPAQAEPPVMQRTSSVAADTTSSAGATNTAGMRHLLAPSVPADFDREGFERIAKMIFIRMQAAHDAADLNDLRQFTTPEMFASVRLDLQERGAAANHTDVVKVDAEVLDVGQEGDRQVVSVRFHGLVREDEGDQPQEFDEVWHLVRHGDGPAWAIAGIQQRP